MVVSINYIVSVIWCLEVFVLCKDERVVVFVFFPFKKDAYMVFNIVELFIVVGLEPEKYNITSIDTERDCRIIRIIEIIISVARLTNVL